MKENVQFLAFLTLNSLFTSENLTLLTFWVTFPIRKYNDNWHVLSFN